MQDPTDVVFEISDWRVDSLAHTLTNGAKEVQVPAKVMAVLVHLARNNERLVTRQELIDVVWDGNAYVGGKSLNNAIWRIRQAFGEGEDGEIIRTTPKTGYQLIPVPEFYEADSEAGASTESAIAASHYLWVAGAIVLVVAIFWAASQRSAAPKRQFDEPLAVVTQMPGRELYANPSPDGTRFAFLHVSPERTSDIYVQSLLDSQEPPLQISSRDADNFGPTWAPDGSHLAYLRVDSKTSPCEIMVWDSKADTEESIGDCVDVGYSTLSWSPNGRWLVYRNSDPEYGPGLYLKAMNADFRPIEELADRRISCENCTLYDHEVSWSPDSRFLAVTRSNNRVSKDVYKFDLETFQFDRLTTGEISIKGHTWYKDGRRLLFVSNKHPANRRIWTIDTETKVKQELGYQGAGFPVYSSDYKSVLFYRRNATTYIASIAIDQEDKALRFPQTIIQTNNAERNPAYSSTADRIAYYSNSSGHNEIWTAAPDGSDRQRITDLKSSAFDPSWSGDGKKLAFVMLNEGSESTNIAVYDFASRSVHTVLGGIGDHGPVSWSHDNQSLIVPVWYGQNVDLWRVSLDGSQLSRLTNTNAKFGRESADGSYLYFAKEYERGLFRLSYATGIETRVIEDLVSSGFGNWTFGRDGEILYSRHRGEFSEIVRFDLASGERTVLVKHPGRTVHRSGMLSYSARHGVLYFTHREAQQIDIMMAPDPLADEQS